MAILKQIYIYPIKSLPGIRLERAKAEAKGLEHDRRYMLVDANGKFITQRSHPAMTQFRCQTGKGQLLATNGNYSIEINDDEYRDYRNVQIWQDSTIALSGSREVDSWFSTLLNDQVRLVRIAEDTERKHGNVSFADSRPYLILGTATLNDINSRTKTQLRFSNFRPNLVIDTDEPYVEDSWKEVKIGTTRFEGFGVCGRCGMVNIDPVTGETQEDVLKILSTYRKMGNRIGLGLWAGLKTGASIAVGDEVWPSS